MSFLLWPPEVVQGLQQYKHGASIHDASRKLICFKGAVRPTARLSMNTYKLRYSKRHTTTVANTKVHTVYTTLLRQTLECVIIQRLETSKCTMRGLLFPLSPNWTDKSTSLPPAPRVPSRPEWHHSLSLSLSRRNTRTPRLLRSLIQLARRSKTTTFLSTLRRK